MNENLDNAIKDALGAIDRFFSDRSRSLGETLEGMIEISDHVESLISALKSDIQDPEE